ncbi:hypothetical protein C8Q78DRAFT_93648 [Trametes maxima]|nr:hypothetical protein C8Q78DRAFT_93648 [Trametes maxima]
MGVQKLPVEIIILVLENFSSTHHSSVERAELASCSLVCYTWKAIAQPLLYRLVNIQTHKRIDLFHDFIVANKRLAATIRGFSLVASIWGNTCPLSPSLFVDILEALPSVRHVELVGITMLGWPDHNRPLPRPSSLKLKKLVVRDVRNGPYPNKNHSRVDLLRLFAEVGELVLTGNVDDEGAGTPAIETAATGEYGGPLPVVRTLGISGPDYFLDYNGTCGGVDGERLRAIDVDVDSEVTARHAGKMFRKYGPNLRELSLNLCKAVLYERPEDTSMWDALDVGALAQVERVTLHIRDHTTVRAKNRPVDELNIEFCKAYDSVLSAFPTCTLRELRWVAVEPMDEAVTLRLVSTHLTPLIARAIEQFSALEQVVLVVRRELPLQKGAATLRKVLPEGVASKVNINFEDGDGPED